MRAEISFCVSRIPTRSVTLRALTEIIYRTLAETGLIHDEGPDKDGGYGPYVQSERQKAGHLHGICEKADRKR